MSKYISKIISILQKISLHTLSIYRGVGGGGITNVIFKMIRITFDSWVTNDQPNTAEWANNDQAARLPGTLT